ncbi:hypothetical protein DNTS_005235 [Danionella cerebrum]|uniref:RING-type E3 ubiquitin transferase n=1 Tax=Danionella cerebrum TaxID=2873325 RepID=A0A553QDF0_9TELE|nr:hypothetical protein DNTS_005235 [Danionella translucida]
MEPGAAVDGGSDPALLAAEDSLLEGVSDPVLLVVLLSAVFLAGVTTLLCRNEHQRIHPENQEQVRLVREQLQSQQVCVLRGSSEALVTPGESGRQYYSDLSCPVCLQQAVLPIETNCGHLFCGQPFLLQASVHPPTPSGSIQLLRSDGLSHGLASLHTGAMGPGSEPSTVPFADRENDKPDQSHDCFLGPGLRRPESYGSKGPIVSPVFQVTLIFPLFSEAVVSDSTSDAQVEPELVLNDITDYNRRFSGQPRSLADRLRDAPVLLRRAFSLLFSVSGLFWMFRLRVCVCVLVCVLYLLSPLDLVPEALLGVTGFIDDLLVLIMLALYITTLYRQLITHTL